MNHVRTINLVRFAMGTLLIVLAPGCGSSDNTIYPPDKPKVQQITCVNNLRQIGISLRMWSDDHNGQLPCNVSTNAGGGLERCAADKEDFDRNAWLYLKTMSNEIENPALLVCPQDRSRKPAASWEALQATNITYRFCFGTNVSFSNPRQIIAVCPVDGNVLYGDGSVEEHGWK